MMNVVSWCSYIESDLYSIERDLYGRQTQIHGSMSYVVDMDSFIGAKTNARSRMCPLFPDVDIDTNVHKEGRRTFSCAFRRRQDGGRSRRRHRRPPYILHRSAVASGMELLQPSMDEHWYELTGIIRDSV